MIPSYEQADRLVYCHCTYAKVVPTEVKETVLHALARSGRSFDAVPDLCEMAARKDPRLAELAKGGDVQIAACYPRAVRWLFHAAGAPLPNQGVEIRNMRVEEAGSIVNQLLGQESGKEVHG